MAIEWEDISGSSNINKAGYDKNNNILAVEFKDGTIYHYQNVHRDEYNNLIGAKSVGKYLHTNIKKGVYKHSKVDRGKEE